MEILFYAFSIIAIFSAIMVVLSKNPLSSALYLVLCFFSLAGFYVILDMQFIAVMQIMVYAGAIMVLVVLVIMLLNLSNSNLKKYHIDLHQKFISALIFLVLLGELILYIVTGKSKRPTGIVTKVLIKKIGNTQIIGKLLFTKYIFPFEVSSILLLVAIIGAYLFAKKRL